MKRDKTKTINLEMAPRFLVSDIYTKKQKQKTNKQTKQKIHKKKTI